MAISSQNIIEERLKELPPDVQNAVLATDLDERIRSIGQRNHLHIDQIGALEDETILVMLGFSDPSTFIDQLRDALHLEEEVAIAIAQEVNDELFKPIRESMKLFARSRATTASEESVAPAAKKAPEPMLQAERMLTEPTLSTPPAPPSAIPGSAKVDPYREPVE